MREGACEGGFVLKNAKKCKRSIIRSTNHPEEVWFGGGLFSIVRLRFVGVGY